MPDQPTRVKVAGEWWERNETRGCFHRVEGNPQCHSLQSLLIHAETASWFRLAALIRAEAEDLSQRGGMVSAEWVAARLEHMADYGCPGPQGRKLCIHNGPAGPSEETT
jgi:hypothetical protein